MNKQSETCISRDQLSDAVYRTGYGFTRNKARELVDQVLSEIAEGLVADSVVLLSGFGRFAVARKAERVGRNPKTGEEHVISARRVVQFKPSSILVKRLSAGPRGHHDT